MPSVGAKNQPSVMPLQTEWSFRVVSLQSFVEAEGQPYASELRQGQFGQDTPHKIALHSAEYSTISRGVPTPRTCLYRNKSLNFWERKLSRPCCHTEFTGCCFRNRGNKVTGYRVSQVRVHLSARNQEYKSEGNTHKSPPFNPHPIIPSSHSPD